jgi:hypothetical protein
MSAISYNDRINESNWEEIKACSYKQKESILIQRGFIEPEDDLPEMLLNELCYENNIFAEEIIKY